MIDRCRCSIQYRMIEFVKYAQSPVPLSPVPPNVLIYCGAQYTHMSLSLFQL